jgi:uncharacterized protein
MSEESHPSPLILPIGTQVVSLVDVRGTDGKPVHPRGAVGVVIQAPADYWHSYRVRFPDGFKTSFERVELSILSHFNAPSAPLAEYNLFDRVIFRCVIGSRAYGLEHDDSDTDRRGVYLPPADLHWSLYGVPEQLDNPDTQETYWEIQKFIVLALKANPNVLECLYSPIVEHATDLVQEMLAMRQSFLSKMVYQTYNGYVLSQFKKLQVDLRNRGEIKWKHVMHLIRLLLAGVTVLKDGVVPVRVEEHREKLLSIRRGEIAFEHIDAWRVQLHKDFDDAFQATRLPERPDYDRANALLLKARRSAL